MVKIMIFGVYALADGYKSLSLELEKYYDISFFPLYVFKDRIEKLNLYDVNTIYDALLGKKIQMDNYINNNHNVADIVLFWYNYDFIKKFKIDKIHFNLLDFIKDIKNRWIVINLNWDPQWRYVGNLPALFDLNFGVNPFINEKHYNYIFFNQGFNEQITYRTNDRIYYKCDVSCIITNLYDNYGDNIACSRRKVLDFLVNRGVNVHIYGPLFLKDIYPNNYKKFISYNDIKYVLSNSLFTLNISPINKNSVGNNHYYSERLALIYSCGTIMITNNTFHNFLTNDSYVHITKPEEIIYKMNKIKNNEALYKKYVKSIHDNTYKLNYKYIVEKTFIPNINKCICD